jgi:hypothetical protein
MCVRSVSVSVTPSCWIRQSLLQRGHKEQLILQGSDQSVGSSEYDIKERSNSSGPHPRMFCLCSPLWWSGPSSGDPDGRSNWKRRVGKILAGGHDRSERAEEGNLFHTSFYQGLPFVWCFLSSFFLSFLRFTVSFSQNRGFPLKAGGSPEILVVKTWQYLLKYGSAVRFAFCCYLPLSSSQNKDSLS